MIKLFSPLTVFWLLVAGGVTIVILARWHRRFLELMAAIVSGLASLFWLVLRARLPLESRVSNWPVVAQLPPWIWHVDETGWQLSGLLLLLLTGALIVTAFTGRERENGKDAGPSARMPSAALALLLTAATLVCVWAESLAGVMAGWMLLLAAWVGTHFAAGREREEQAGRVLPGMGWLLLSLFFLWLAAAYVPLGANFSLVMTEWPQVATSSVLTAALLQMGVWPFHSWRQLARPADPLAAMLLPIIPAIAGASLLSRLVSSSDISTGYALFLTAFSLLGLLLAVQRLWLHLHSPGGLMGALALGQASIALLAGVWGGPAALLAETTVLALAPGTLFLATTRPVSRPRWGQRVGSLVAIAALAGLPLSAAFGGRAALYDGLLANGRSLLTLVTALMTLALLAAVIMTAWQRETPQEAADERAAGRIQPADLVRVFGMWLPAVGLLSLSGVAQAPVRAGTWLAILLPAVGSLVLVRYVGSVHEARTALQRAFAWHFFATIPQFLWRTWLRRLDAAVRDVAAILDGEGGMLWLLVLAILLLVVR